MHALIVTVGRTGHRVLPGASLLANLSRRVVKDSRAVYSLSVPQVDGSRVIAPPGGVLREIVLRVQDLPLETSHFGRERIAKTDQMFRRGHSALVQMVRRQASVGSDRSVRGPIVLARQQAEAGLSGHVWMGLLLVSVQLLGEVPGLGLRG
jgi:hypothetical protein